MQKKVVLFIIMVAAIALGIIILITKDEEFMRKKMIQNEKKLIQFLQENKDALLYLENEIIPIGSELRINRNSNQEVIFKKGLRSLNLEQQEKIKYIFEQLKCDRILLFEKNGEILMDITLEDGKIDNNNIYNQILTYSKNAKENLGKKIMPNWYYKTLFLT